MEIDKQATSKQPCSSSAAGNLDRAHSDGEDSSDDCEVDLKLLNPNWQMRSR